MHARFGDTSQVAYDQFPTHCESKHDRHQCTRVALRKNYCAESPDGYTCTLHCAKILAQRTRRSHLQLALRGSSRAESLQMVTRATYLHCASKNPHAESPDGTCNLHCAKSIAQRTLMVTPTTCIARKLLRKNPWRSQLQLALRNNFRTETLKVTPATCIARKLSRSNPDGHTRNLHCATILAHIHLTITTATYIA